MGSQGGGGPLDAPPSWVKGAAGEVPWGRVPSHPGDKGQVVFCGGGRSGCRGGRAAPFPHPAMPGVPHLSQSHTLPGVLRGQDRPGRGCTVPTSWPCQPRSGAEGAAGEVRGALRTRRSAGLPCGPPGGGRSPVSPCALRGPLSGGPRPSVPCPRVRVLQCLRGHPCFPGPSRDLPTSLGLLPPPEPAQHSPCPGGSPERRGLPH